MANASNYLEDAVLNFISAGTALTGITPYLALYTSDPEDDNSGTEASGTDYARVDISSSFPTASGGGTLTNNAAITFPAAGTGGWGTVTHFGILDASTGGNLLAHGALTSPSSITVNDGTEVNFPSGSLDITVA